jgi:hypothetical protein
LRAARALPLSLGTHALVRCSSSSQRGCLQMLCCSWLEPTISSTTQTSPRHSCGWMPCSTSSSTRLTRHRVFSCLASRTSTPLAVPTTRQLRCVSSTVCWPMLPPVMALSDCACPADVLLLVPSCPTCMLRRHCTLGRLRFILLTLHNRCPFLQWHPPNCPLDMESNIEAFNKALPALVSKFGSR